MIGTAAVAQQNAGSNQGPRLPFSGTRRRRPRDSPCGDARIIEVARKMIAKICLEIQLHIASLISNAYYRSDRDPPCEEFASDS